MKLTDEIKRVGFAVCSGLLTPEQVEAAKRSMYDIHMSRPEREVGVLRLMIDEDPSLLFLLELPQMLAIVDELVGPTAILHVQNGFIMPSTCFVTANFQNTMHMDFPRLLNGYRASVNVLVALDEFNKTSGGTRIRVGSHHGGQYCEEIDIECQPGDAIVFDSTIQHCAGSNTSGKDRCAINHQFTKPWIKQQIDYPRALEWLEDNLKERTKQILGFYARVPASLEEYYRVPRVYREGQG